MKEIRLTPDYFAGRTTLGFNEPNMLSVYKSAIRFTKGAQTLLDVPKHKVTFIIRNENVFILPDEFGWTVEPRGSNGDMLISRRVLCAKLLDHFNAKAKVCLKLESTPDQSIFQLKSILTK